MKPLAEHAVKNPSKRLPDDMRREIDSYITGFGKKLKAQAKKNKVRLTYTNRFGQRKYRKPSAVRNEIAKKQK